MATTPTIITVTQSELAALAHRQVSVSYWLIGLLGLFLALGTFAGYLGLRHLDKLEARAEATEASYVVERKALTDLLAADTVARAQESAQQAAVLESMAKRAVVVQPPVIQTALQPSASATEAAAGVTLAFAGVPSFGQALVSPDGQNVSLAVPEAQTVIQTKIQMDRLTLDVQDETQLYTLEQSKSTSLSNDLGKCTDTLGLAQKTINGYKAVVKPTKWQRFLQGAEKVGLVAIGIAAGRAL